MGLFVQTGILQDSGNLPISYRMMWPEKPDSSIPAVILAPGFGSSLQTSPYIEHSLKHVAALGAVAVSFNYSHTSVKDKVVDTGKLTCENAEDDVRRMIDFARSNSMVDPDSVVGMGCSFGAHTLLRLKDESLAAYILFSLVPDFAKPFQDKLTPQKRMLWKLSQSLFGRGTRQMISGDVQEINYHLFEQAEKFDIKKKVQELKKPLTIIHGTEDILASVDDIKALQQNPGTNVHFIEGAGHAFSLEPKKGDTKSELQQAIQFAQQSFLNLFTKQARQVTELITGPVADIGLNDNIQNFVPALLKNNDNNLKMA